MAEAISGSKTRQGDRPLWLGNCGSEDPAINVKCTTSHIEHFYMHFKRMDPSAEAVPLIMCW